MFRCGSDPMGRCRRDHRIKERSAIDHGAHIVVGRRKSAVDCPLLKRILFDIAQQPIENREANSPTIGNVRGLSRRRTDYRRVARSDWRRQDLIRVMKIVRRQADLLQLIGAFGSPGRLATACTAGRSREIRMPMMAMTTSSSTRVNARRARGTTMRSCRAPRTGA